MSDSARMRAVVESAQRIAQERRKTLEEMRRALLREDQEAALRCARQLTGLDEGEDGDASDRAPARLN